MNTCTTKLFLQVQITSIIILNWQSNSLGLHAGLYGLGQALLTVWRCARVPPVLDTAGCV